MKYQGKRILLGVTGSVAAYKAAELLRLLVKAGHDVTVVQTSASRNFVGETTFQALSGNPVYCQQFPEGARDALAHIGLAASDLIVVAPATANTIGKMAAGLADNLLLSIYLAASCPVVICPAMNEGMWRHPAVQENLAQLRRRGVTIIAPETGALACGTEGEGRLAEPRSIFSAISEIINQEAAPGLPSRRAEKDLTGRRILITTGATREPIDTVRYITNRSSGRMGFALADAARARGAEVTVIAANCLLERNPGVRYIDISTNDELTRELEREFEAHEILIMAAAVADFRVLSTGASGKLERRAKNDLQLAPTSDIVQSLGRGQNGHVKVGFAAEFGRDNLTRARRKLKAKNLDIIVFNDISRDDIGFDSEDNEIVIITANGEDEFVSKTTKEECAHRILDRIEAFKP